MRAQFFAVTGFTSRPANRVVACTVKRRRRTVSQELISPPKRPLAATWPRAGWPAVLHSRTWCPTDPLRPKDGKEDSALRRDTMNEIYERQRRRYCTGTTSLARSVTWRSTATRSSPGKASACRTALPGSSCHPARRHRRRSPRRADVRDAGARGEGSGSAAALAFSPTGPGAHRVGAAPAAPRVPSVLQGPLRCAFRWRRGRRERNLRMAVCQVSTPVLFRRSGAIVPLDDRSPRRVDFGAGGEPCVPVSWGDIATAFHSTGVGNITVYFGRTKLLRSSNVLGKVFGPLLRRRIGQKGLRAIVRSLPAGPRRSGEGWPPNHDLGGSGRLVRGVI